MNIDRPFRPIAELLMGPDFPEGTLGELVDIGGYTGEVVGIVHDSIRVKAPEGVTRGFNVHVLRKLYGPRLEEAPLPTPAPAEEPSQPALPSQIEEPNFEQEIKPI